MSIYFGVFWAQSRKLPEISAKFGRFLSSQNLLGAPIPKVIHTLSRLPRATSPGKVSSGYPHESGSYKHAHAEF